MHKPYSMVRGLVRSNPLPLTNLKDKNLIKLANSYLPVDTGFEIECSFKSRCSENNYNVPNLVHIDCDYNEQRFRIPKGIDGLICLYNICEQLKQYSNLNPSSGIHYHIDFTDMFPLVNHKFLKSIEKETLNKLQCWNYTGKFNTNSVSFDKTRVKFHKEYKTIEFRIGEMSFDYEVLVARIIHCHKIVNEIKKSLLKYKH